MRAHFYKPQLDVVRFLAFFAVFGHHVLPRDRGNSNWLGSVADACGFGLSLFFVLSAYLIALILMREHETTGTICLRDFYLRRMLRIWPLYLTGLAIGVLRACSHGVLDQQKMWFVAALLLAGNLVPSGGILMSHLWSISVEEQFYMLLPGFTRAGRKGLIVLAVFMVLVANVTLVHFAQTHADMDTTVWFNSLVQFEMFAAGIALALVDHRLRGLNTFAGVVLVTVSCILALSMQWAFHIKSQHVAAAAATGLCTAYAGLAFACCLFITGMQRLPVWPPLAYLGKISYGLYVFHIPAIAVVGSHLRWAGMNVLGSLILTLLLAALSYRLLEKPFLLLKRHFETIPTRPA